MALTKKTRFQFHFQPAQNSQQIQAFQIEIQVTAKTQTR